MTDSERVKSVINWSKMTTNEFYASLWYERAMNFYNIINGKTNLSVKICKKICDKYPLFRFGKDILFFN